MTLLDRARVGGLVVAAGLVLAACGGGPSESAGSSATQSATASVGDSSGASASASASGGGGSGFDLDTATGAVSNLDSYQVDVTVKGASGEQTMTVVSTKDPKATHYTMQGIEFITIEGEGAWMKQGDAWVDAPGGADAYLSMFDALAPDTLIGAYGLSAYGGAFREAGTEEHNGVQALHFHLDATDVAAAGGGSFPDDGVVDIWVAQDGQYLVGMHYAGTDPDSGAASEVQIEVSHVNDASISIEAPM